MSRQVIAALCTTAIATAVSAHPGAAWPARAGHQAAQPQPWQWQYAATDLAAAFDKYPILECKIGNAKWQYDKGCRQAEATFAASWSFLQQDCTQLDGMYNDLLSACPMRRKCPRKGYLATLETKYKEAQRGCFSGCLGT